MDQDSVQNFIQKNTVTTKEGRKCVDGRYQADDNSGMIARPGGDFGYVMGLLSLENQGKLDLTPEEAFDAVYDIVTKDGETFYMHTDTHAPASSIGCGHIAKATLPENAKAYGVDPMDVQLVLEYAQQKARSGASIKIVELPGDHKEQGVLVVTNDQKTVNPHDETEMYFVYDKTRDEEFIKNLVEKLNIDGLTLEDFKNALEQQTNATLHLLALGKPIYQVDAATGTEQKIGEVN